MPLTATRLTDIQLQQLDEELLFLTKLKEQKGLEEIKDDRLKSLAKDGIIAVVCPDGDHSVDIFGHLCQFNDCKRVHLPALNGGGMLISPTNPHFDLEGRALISSVRGAWKMGKGNTIVVLSHWPCGQARADAMPVRQVILDTLHADTHLTHLLNLHEDVVLPMFHVDWTPLETDLTKKRRRTYIIKNACHKIFQEW